MTRVRPAAVAETFYPADPGELDAQVRALLGAVPRAAGPPPKAIIAPHAGYIYSGPVAASAYAAIRPLRPLVRRVVILGPCHRVAVRGLALPRVDAFETPLGRVPLDRETCERIAPLPQVLVLDPTHRDEHALEVQLPFLQEVLGEFAIVPLVVGEASPEQVAEVLDWLWGGAETLIVISTDLSHYLDYETARQRDAATCRSIEALSAADIGPYDACGHSPLSGLLQTAKARGMTVQTLDLRNSGDTTGGKSRVVGYGAWALSETAC